MGQIHNIDNRVAPHQNNHTEDLCCTVKDNQKQPNHQGCISPYSQLKQASSTSTNLYKKNPVSRKSLTSTVSMSPTLTQDQIKRMENSRNHALAIRTKRKNSPTQDQINRMEKSRKHALAIQKKRKDSPSK